MPDHLIYLLLNIGAISVPIAFSFYSKAPFAKTIKSIVPALIFPMLFFVVWDVFFTDWGHWGFNDRYLVGIRYFGLPIEEWLFFLCIPYACLFTYFAFRHLKPVNLPWFNKFTMTISIGLLALAIANYGRDYTFTTGIFLGIYLAYLSFTNQSFLTQFFLSFVLILIPFFLINGVLTGSWIEEQVVWYNNAENLGIRLGTIPIEDPFYGMLLLLMNVHIWEKLNNKPSSAPKLSLT